MEEAIDTSLFEEPEDFRPPPPEPTFEKYTRQQELVKKGEPSEITVRLVGKSPLWGHLLWNAALVTCDFIDQNREQYITGKTVLELGAAAALPSLVAALTADNVVVTDYPDPDLMNNIDHNIGLLNAHAEYPLTSEGYIWGYDTTDLLNAKGQKGRKFDFIILSDLIFNHTEHQKLIKSCDECLADNGVVLVVFTHHRPKLAHKDLAFFPQAEEQAGFKSEKIIEKVMTPMFAEDEGPEIVRATVHGYLMRK
uniref:ARAD1D13354p n=1 Tax=Blastobotrys adeninivorans TaxID=409370 RepID=A0A060T9P1_BLAAD